LIKIDTLKFAKYFCKKPPFIFEQEWLSEGSQVPIYLSFTNKAKYYYL